MEPDELMRAAMVEGVRGLTDWVRSEAIRQAPVREGTLRASPPPISVRDGTLTRTPATVEGRVVFPLVYAARQHEETTWRHPKGGKAKYLEDPMKEMAGRAERLLGAYVKRCVEAGRVIPWQQAVRGGR